MIVKVPHPRRNSPPAIKRIIPPGREFVLWLQHEYETSAGRHGPDVGVERQLPAVTSGSRHHEHLPGARVLGGEGDLVISGATPTVLSLFKLTRIDRVFTLVDTEEDALRTLNA